MSDPGASNNKAVLGISAETRAVLDSMPRVVNGPLTMVVLPVCMDPVSFVLSTDAADEDSPYLANELETVVALAFMARARGRRQSEE